MRYKIVIKEDFLVQVAFTKNETVNTTAQIRDYIKATKLFYLQTVENRACVYLYRNGWFGFFFVTGLEILQILGVEMSTRRLDRVKCKVIWIISYDLFINNYTKYLIIKLYLLKKNSKKVE
jgi:hypothetical protein